MILRSKKTKAIQLWPVVLIAVLVLVGCSKGESEKQAASSDKSTEQQQPVGQGTGSVPAVQPLKSGYKVIDSFNVGQNVYVRSMTTDPVSKTLWVGTSVGVLEIDINTRNMLNINYFILHISG